MASAPQLLHLHILPAGCGGAEQIDSPCWLCGASARHGVPVSAWAGASFTGQNRVRCPSSSYVCEACVWLCSRTSPVPGRPPKEGKEFGGNFRNYSHVYEYRALETDYQNFSKGEKPGLLAWLRVPHPGTWWAAIADSGQKHVIPWAPINPPGARRGVLLFEEQLVTLPDGEHGWHLVDQAAALLTAGATKEEIKSGDYGARAWQLCGEALPVFEQAHAGARGSSWFALALWLAQRDEETVQARICAEKETKKNAKALAGPKRTARIGDGRPAPAHAPRVSRGRREPAQALGSDIGPTQGGGADLDECARVGDGAAQELAAGSAGQLALFGDRALDRGSR